MQPELLPFAERLNPVQQRLMEILHSEIMQLPGMVMKERYRLPFYYGRSWICYLNPVKQHAVELCFTRGVELEDVHCILSANGRKQISGYLCTSPETLPIDAILDTLHEAYLLDKEKRYQHPGKRGGK